MGKFLQALRDEKRIMANVCPRCGRSQVPPREACAVCRAAATQFEEVGPAGTLRNFDVVYYASPDPVTGQSREVPYATAYVELDGAKGGATFWHELRETDMTKLRAASACGPSSRRTANGRGRSPTSNTSRSSRGRGSSEARLPPRDAGRRTPESDAFVVKGTFALPYNYFAGRVGSTWLVALRDEQKIYGVRHPKRERSSCRRGRSTKKTSPTSPAIGSKSVPEGRVTGFTVVRYREPYQPLPVPFGLALIQLDGADTSLVHVVRGEDLGQLSVGGRVRAVFARERKATILDISHFAPV